MSVAEYNCYKNSFRTFVRKEECKDAVVPDTLPDIRDVLCCEGRMLIRSKDVSVGRVKTEVNVNAEVLYKGEDEKIYSVNVVVPIIISAEDESIGDKCPTTAALELIRLDARALNPRKIFVRAEVGCEILVFENSSLVINNIDSEEYIKSKKATKQVSFISAVSEKTFALTDELSLPTSSGAVGSVSFTGCKCLVDDVKTVGTKLVIKGRVKCAFCCYNPDGEIFRFENTRDYSQVIELGFEVGQGEKNVWIIPSGAYCSYNENEKTVSLELHMVAQFICRCNVSLEYVDDVYSNRFNLNQERREIKLEYVDDPICVRENVKQLFETSGVISDIVYSLIWAERALVKSNGIVLPLNISFVCKNGENIWCENRKTEISLRLPDADKKYFAENAEIEEYSLLPVPGGVELRLMVSARVCGFKEEIINFVSGISYKEEDAIDNSEKPSITLLRVKENDELWNLARNNCSSPDAILNINNIENLSSAVGKLILIPKTY